MAGDSKTSSPIDARHLRPSDKSTQYEPEYRQSLALLIGIDSYDDPRFMTLGKAEDDAQAIYDLLASQPYNFTVRSLIGKEATKEAILDELFRLRTTEADARILVYFAGHGYTLTDKFGKETGFVAAYNTDAKIDYTALKLNEITDLCRNATAKHLLFIFDACFSGAALGLTRAQNVSADKFLTRRAFQVLCAGTADQTVSDFNSMTNLVLEELRSEEVEESTGLYTLGNLGLVVQQRMTADSGKTQIPQFGHLRGSEGGDFVFRLAEPLAKLPQWILDAAWSEDSGERLMAVDRLHQLVQGDDPGMANLALTEIQRLVEDKSSMVVAAAKAALDKVTPGEEPTPRRKPVVKPKLDVLTITSPIQLTLIRIPAGDFIMGSDSAKDKDAYENEQPQHRVYVPAFYIGKYPVTNAQYKVFLEATGRSAPKNFKGVEIQFPSDKENYPVGYTSVQDAVAFCDWMSTMTDGQYRLPSEAEWEKAARGTDGRIFPWGNEWDPTRCHSFLGDRLQDPAPVSKYSPQGDSLFGVAGMAGNVKDLTRSLRKPYPYNPEDGREDSGSEIDLVTRGGTANSSRKHVRCAYRGRIYEHTLPGELSRGFRVVVSPSDSWL
jgi:formylglycine-generating enzyme required for sulfatase activity